MTNHPNRSKHAAIRYIVYSVASMNALAEGTSVVDAIGNSGENDTDFLVVVTTRSQDALYRFDALPRDCTVVWRGANDLAQRFRART